MRNTQLNVHANFHTCLKQEQQTGAWEACCSCFPSKVPKQKASNCPSESSNCGNSCFIQEKWLHCSQGSLRTLHTRLCSLPTQDPQSKTLRPSAMTNLTFTPIFIAVLNRKHCNGACKARCAHFACDYVHCCLQYPKSKTLWQLAKSNWTFMPICTAVLSRKNANSARKARCAHFTHDSVHCPHRIPKARPSGHRPWPTWRSRQFSYLYKTGNTVTVLAKLAAHALLVIMCAADYNIPKAKPSSHWPSPTEHSCQFSQLYKAGSTLTVLAKLAAHALHAILHAACTRSRNKDPLTIGHVHLNVHANFPSCIKQRHANCACKACCAPFERDCARCEHKIPKQRPSSRQPCRSYSYNWHFWPSGWNRVMYTVGKGRTFCNFLE